MAFSLDVYDRPAKKFNRRTDCGTNWQLMAIAARGGAHIHHCKGKKGHSGPHVCRYCGNVLPYSGRFSNQILEELR